MDAKTVVRTAYGDVKEFGDYASKFIVLHPKTSATIAFIAGWIVHWMF